MSSSIGELFKKRSSNSKKHTINDEWDYNDNRLFRIHSWFHSYNVTTIEDDSENQFIFSLNCFKMMEQNKSCFNCITDKDVWNKKNRGCTGCLRNSPVPSLFAMIIVLLGIGAFSCGYLTAFQNQNDGFQRVSVYSIPVFDSQIATYVIYGLLPGTAVYVILCYILAAFSTSYNRKRFFEGSQKTKVGRCCTVFNILILTFAIMLWILLFCYTGLLFLILYTESDSRSKNSTITISLKSTEESIKRNMICLTIAFGGSFVAVLGLVQMLCCSIMNFVRLGEERYYEDMSYVRHKPDQVLSSL